MYGCLYSSSFMKLGMSLTGRLLACAFTRRFLSSVSRTTLSLSPVCMCVCVGVCAGNEGSNYLQKKTVCGGRGMLKKGMPAWILYRWLLSVPESTLECSCRQEVRIKSSFEAYKISHVHSQWNVISLKYSQVMQNIHNSEINWVETRKPIYRKTSI